MVSGETGAGAGALWAPGPSRAATFSGLELPRHHGVILHTSLGLPLAGPSTWPWPEGAAPATSPVILLPPPPSFLARRVTARGRAGSAPHAAPAARQDGNASLLAPEARPPGPGWGHPVDRDFHAPGGPLIYPETSFRLPPSPLRTRPGAPSSLLRFPPDRCFRFLTALSGVRRKPPLVPGLPRKQRPPWRSLAHGPCLVLPRKSVSV